MSIAWATRLPERVAASIPQFMLSALEPTKCIRPTGSIVCGQNRCSCPMGNGNRSTKSTGIRGPVVDQNLLHGRSVLTGIMFV